MKDNRKVKVIISKAGGNASANSLNYKLSIPSKWISDMKITTDNRTVELIYDNEIKEILIKKESETDENRK